MRPELFRIPLPFTLDLFGHRVHEIPIYGYGLMLVIGFLLAAQWARILAKRSGLDGELFINAALIALFVGIIGARLSHVLENLAQFTRPDRSAWENFREMIDLPSGGLTYYGGFLLAFPTLVLYAVWKKVPVRLGMDIVAPVIVLALGFGRIGCFLNGCCYGAPCNLPWAVHYPYYSSAYIEQFANGQVDKSKHPVPDALLKRADDDSGRILLKSPADIARDPDSASLEKLAAEQHSFALHPAQLYSTFTCFLMAALLYAYFTVPHIPGRVFALMLMLEGTTRYLLELVRAEPAVLGPMSLSMILGIVLLAVGIALWHVFGRPPAGARHASPSAPPP